MRGLLSIVLSCAVVTAADRVTLVSEPMTALYRERYRDLPGEKFLTLPNGVDSDDWRRAAELPPRGDDKDDGRCVLLHAGQLAHRPTVRHDRQPSGLALHQRVQRGVVVAAGDEAPAIGAEGHGAHVGGVALDREDFLGSPRVPNLGGAIKASRRQARAIRTVSDIAHTHSVAAQRQQSLTAGQVPHARRLIDARCGEARPIGSIGDA